MTDKLIDLNGLSAFKSKMDASVDEKIAGGVGVKYQIKNEDNKIVLEGSDGSSSNATIPSELSDLTDDAIHRTVTDTEKEAWNNKAETSAIPTESTVSNWGFTKNTGTYSKPEGGIPKTDFDESVKASLGKADTALQSFAETDPTVPSHVKSITEGDISNWNAKVDASALSNYALASESGYDLGLSIDLTTYVMTLELKNKAGTVLSTKTLDFPIESMVVGATYADGKITLTLQNGQTLDVDISAIVGGLVNDSFTIAGIDMKDNITAAELKTALGVPTKTSELTNDSGFLTAHQDISGKMDKNNPTGTGSFSLNRLGDAGDYSFAEGYNATASGQYSHAEGLSTKATNKCSHAEGNQTNASGYYSHAEGADSTASGSHSHAEGCHTTASGTYAHAEGCYTTASGTSNHAEGTHTIASGTNQHVQGAYNIEDKYNILHIVGNGSSEDNRSNAHTLDKNGNAWFAGDIYVGSTSGTNKDEGSVKLAKVNEIPATLPASDVYDWAKAATKPTYTANEVGALPSNGTAENAKKVNGLTVEAAVPANAKFTDTTYDVATSTANGLMSSTDKARYSNVRTEIFSTTEPSGQLVNDIWNEEY